MSLTITVVIATYNRPKLVLRAVESAWRQADSIVVVNDGSSVPYDVATILRGRPNVHYVELPENSGVQAARNAGLDSATTDLVLILDDDDELIEGAVSRICSSIAAMADYKDFPVFNFAHSNADLCEKFAIVNHGHYLSGALKGDFVPVFNRSYPVAIRYPVHDIRVGVDHLLWWPLAEQYGIPTWRDIVVAKIHSDAAIRMTSPRTFVSKADAFAVMQDMTLSMLSDRGWQQAYPSAYRKRALALLLYALAAGNGAFVRRASQELPFPLGPLVSVFRFLPTSIFRHLLYWMKRFELRHSH